MLNTIEKDPTTMTLSNWIFYQKSMIFLKLLLTVLLLMKLSKSNHQNSAIFQGKEQQTKGDNKFKNLAA